MIRCKKKDRLHKTAIRRHRIAVQRQELREWFAKNPEAARAAEEAGRLIRQYVRGANG